MGNLVIVFNLSMLGSEVLLRAPLRLSAVFGVLAAPFPVLALSVPQDQL